MNSFPAVPASKQSCGATDGYRGSAKLDTFVKSNSLLGIFLTCAYKAHDFALCLQFLEALLRLVPTNDGNASYYLSTGEEDGGDAFFVVIILNELSRLIWRIKNDCGGVEIFSSGMFLEIRRKILEVSILSHALRDPNIYRAALACAAAMPFPAQQPVTSDSSNINTVPRDCDKAPPVDIPVLSCDLEQLCGDLSDENGSAFEVDGDVDFVAQITARVLCTVEWNR